MGKAVLLSIQPKWCELIASGKKTLEVRKTKPKIKTPFKCYIYCTRNKDGVKDLLEVHSKGKIHKANSKVIGEFVCDNIECVDIPYPAYQEKLDELYIEQSCVPYYALHRYCYHDNAYFWHISDLVIYDKPKELSELKKPCSCTEDEDEGEICRDCTNCDRRIKMPPQSWCYVKEREENGDKDKINVL